jgi:outer membrane autotransporter protein
MDASVADTVSDTLVVDGTSVGPGGPTQISIRNAGGMGAETVGDGILVVEVLNQSRSAPGAFTLASGPPIEVDGPFAYELFRGGAPGTGSNPGDWFLRNDFVTPPITPPVTPPIEPSDPLPPTPPPDPLPPNVLLPIIGPDLATYGVVQPLARQLGLTTLGTLHERVGDTYEPDCVASVPAAETSGVDLPTKKPAAVPTKKPGPAPCSLFSPSAWARFFGGTSDNRYQAFADPRTHGNFWGFQGGVDLLRGPLIPGGYDRAGLYGAYSNSNNNVDGLVTNPAATAYILTHTGSVNLNAWSGGAYWTHVGPGGWYLDAVLQGTVYTGTAATPSSSLRTDGTGFIASLEGGYPIPLWFWPQLVLEPQGQILWQHVGLNHEFDGFQNVNLGSTNGPTGRLGLLLGRRSSQTADRCGSPMSAATSGKAGGRAPRRLLALRQSRSRSWNKRHGLSSPAAGRSRSTRTGARTPKPAISSRSHRATSTAMASPATLGFVTLGDGAVGAAAERAKLHNARCE